MCRYVIFSLYSAGSIMRFSSVVSREVTVFVISVLIVKFCLELGNVDDFCEEGMA